MSAQALLGLTMLIVMIGAIFIGFPISFTLLFLALAFGYAGLGATVFDLVLPRLLAGLAVDSAWLAGLGAGGLLTRDVAARFPPYRPRQERGAVE